MNGVRSFATGLGRGKDWGQAAKACLDDLRGKGGTTEGATLGFVYVTESLVDDLPGVLTFLRAKTGVEHWAGAAGIGVFGGGEAAVDGAAVAVMLGRFPRDSFRVFSGPADMARVRRFRGGWALAHGDPRDRDLETALADFTTRTGCAPVGGLTVVNRGARQIADHPVEGPFSGVAFIASAAPTIGVAQGCFPVGPPHRLTGHADNIALTLDDRPALDALKDDIGEILSRDIRRAAGFIHAALCDAAPPPPFENPVEARYRVRALLGVDPERKAVVLGASLSGVAGLRFVKRDPNDARHALDLMLVRAADGLGPRLPVGAIYVSCAARAGSMFAPEGEVAYLGRHLPGVPVIGFYANGEIAGSDVHTHTGVLILFGEIAE